MIRMLRTSFLCTLVLAISFNMSGQVSRSNDHNVDGEFYFGTHLFRSPMPPMAELKNDLDNLKKNGFNLIKIQTQWAIDEPNEGKYDFSRYEEIIQYAQKLGLKIYLGLTLEHAPAWLFSKYPSVRMVGKNGVPVKYEATYTLPADGKPGPCFYHPVAAERQKRYIQAIVKALGKYENIVVWNTWQEIGLWSESTAGISVDYSEYSIRYFKDWLKNKYGNLQQLNNAWATNFSDWIDVGPNRQSYLGTKQDIDWKYFMDNIYVTGILKNRYAIIKSADPLKRTVFAHKSSPAIASTMDWEYAKSQDFLGSSSYPAWFPFNKWDDVVANGTKNNWYPTCLTEMWNSMALNFDYLHSANTQGKPLWAAEFQGGPVSASFQKGRVPSPDDIRRWMLTAIGSGVTTISFWVTRSEIMANEDNGFGLLDSEGETTPRFDEAARVGKALLKHKDLFSTPALKTARVGIIVNQDNFDFTSTYFSTGQHLLYSTRGWYKMLWDLGIPVDFVSITDINSQTPGQYKALILPFPISLSDTKAQLLETYVMEGGNLISEGSPGRMNENGISQRGEMSPRLRKLFDVRQTSFKMIDEPGSGTRWMPDQRGWGERLGFKKLAGTGILLNQSINPNFYVQFFEVGQSKAILKYDDEVAGAVNSVGKGKAWIFGSFIGHCGTAYADQANLSFVKKLMEECGVVSDYKGKLLLRKRIGSKKEAWIFTNNTDKEVTETVSVEGWSNVTELLGAPIQRSGNTVNLTVSPLDVKVLIFQQ